MIILRIAGGIRDHFPARVTEWIMTLPLLGWSFVLASATDTFSSSVSFSELARYGTEYSWSMLCLFAFACRLIALVVNGTFKESFRHAPHLRAGASVIACIFWGQITLGTTMAFLLHGGAGTGPVAYGTFVAIEIWNLFRAWADVGASQRRH